MVDWWVFPETPARKRKVATLLRREAVAEARSLALGKLRGTTMYARRGTGIAWLVSSPHLCDTDTYSNSKQEEPTAQDHEQERRGAAMPDHATIPFPGVADKYSPLSFQNDR
jgi:hypothetical protein